MKKTYVWGLLITHQSAPSSIDIKNCDASVPLITGGNLTKVGKNQQFKI